MSKLDPSLISQLQTIYKDLQSPISLCYFNSTHPKQQELLDMLTDVASTSDKIQTEALNDSSDYPRFKIQKSGQDTGITFSGIPGGHEFSSLILAILNSDLKGKLPDEMIQNRIQALKGPINLRTVISLSCENCPDVVQALNLMAILKEDFNHEMVDGEFIQQELEKLKIQGVPAVVSGENMIHSGKTNLSELLQKLETHFGKKRKPAETSRSRRVRCGGDWWRSGWSLRGYLHGSQGFKNSAYHRSNWWTNARHQGHRKFYFSSLHRRP